MEGCPRRFTLRQSPSELGWAVAGLGGRPVTNCSIEIRDTSRSWSNGKDNGPAYQTLPWRLIGRACARHLRGAAAPPRLPREYRARAADPQFFAVPGSAFGYVNAPNAALRFTYDGNPRGYFGPSNEVVHHTNAHGFRGSSPLKPKTPGIKRFVFWGLVPRSERGSKTRTRTSRSWGTSSSRKACSRAEASRC